VTPDEYEPDAVDVRRHLARAALNTRLAPGDVIAAPGGQRKELVRPGDVGEIGMAPFGALRNPVGQRGSASA
jgi:2-keto-4-pentenoate hydratase/2-oxohepta-3-ene-1,7-dioic acid hydratase in catechol pathway